MGNAFEIAAPNDADKAASAMVVKFLGVDQKDEDELTYGSRQVAAPLSRYVTNIVINSGEAPSYAAVAIPLKDFTDEAAYTVALQKSGPTGEILLRRRASCGFLEGGNYVPLMNGTLVAYRHDLGADHAIAEIFDDRLELSKINCFGRFVYQPRDSGSAGAKIYFDANSDLVFNDRGPDCMDSPSGPRFAPSAFYGWNISNTVEPVPGQATIRSRSWRGQDFIRYLADIYRDGQFAHGSDGYKLKSLPYYVQWPLSIANVDGSERHIKNMNLQNRNLLQALSEVLRKMGPYELTTMPSGDHNTGFASTLGIADMNPSSEKNVTQLYTSDDSSFDIGAAINDALIIKSGYLSESIVNYYDDVAIIGDAPAVEKMLSMTTLPNPPATILLEKGWSTEEETAFKNYIDTNNDSEAAYLIATDLWPNVYSAYRTKVGADLFAGTKWAGRKIGGNHARFKPTLLTGGVEADLLTPGTWHQKTIYVEIETSPNVWVKAGRFDGLELSQDRFEISFPALRDNRSTIRTWKLDAGAAGDYDGDKMLPLNIRLTAAVEADWAIVGTAGRDYNNTMPRMAKTDSFWTYHFAAKPLDYVDWLRKDAYHEGGANTKATDYATTNNEIFSDLLDPKKQTGRIGKHAIARQKDLRRIEYSGQLVISGFRAGLRPGQGVKIIGPDVFSTFSVIKSVSFSAESQDTTIELAGPDRAKIYDSPQVLSTRSGSYSGPDQSTGRTYTGQESSAGTTHIDSSKAADDSYDYDQSKFNSGQGPAAFRRKLSERANAKAGSATRTDGRGTDSEAFKKRVAEYNKVHEDQINYDRAMNDAGGDRQRALSLLQERGEVRRDGRGPGSESFKQRKDEFDRGKEARDAYRAKQDQEFSSRIKSRLAADRQGSLASKVARASGAPGQSGITMLENTGGPPRMKYTGPGSSGYKGGRNVDNFLRMSSARSSAMDALDDIGDEAADDGYN